MVWKYVKAILLIVVCSFAIYMMFATIDVDISGSVTRSGDAFDISYEVVNNSIAPLTLYKENKTEEAYVEILFYDSNKRPIRNDIEDPDGEFSKGILDDKKGPINTYSSSINLPIKPKLAKAMYVRFRVRVDKKYIDDTFEKNISFLRKNRIISDYILIS